MGERVIMSREILFKAKRKDNGEIICECFRGYTTEIINHGNIFDNLDLLEVE